MRTINKIPEYVEKYRQLVQKYIDLHTYGAALFWADKVVALTDSPRDVYWLAQCIYLQKQYHRAAHLLQSKQLDKSHTLCTYLTVKCFYEAGEYNEALKVINASQFNSLSSTGGHFNVNMSDIDMNVFEDIPKTQALSAFLLLKGKVLEGMDNRGLAADCYKQALQCDVYCFEALDCLVKYQMLNATEEQELLQSIPIAEQCSADEAEIIMTLYEARLKKYHTPLVKVVKSAPLININAHLPPSMNQQSLAVTPNMQSTPMMISTPLNVKNSKRVEAKNQENAMHLCGNEPQNVALVKLQQSLDLCVSQAEMLYYNCDYQKCINLTEQILKKDPYHDECLPIHIACLIELKQSNKLFSLAHKLVDLYPNLATSWFAVGCYYYTIGKSDSARRYLAKATCLDKLFGPAWLAYGHSFAVENEHDQAMAAYFKASQLMKGCHLPLLYIGLECGLTNNVRLAEKFFQQAQSIAPEDPFIIHEKGVICFHNQDYEAAEINFREALDRTKRIRRGPLPVTWAALLNNLGHTCRKLKKYEEALEFHNKALLLNPQSASTFSAIAYIYVLLENYDEAVNWFHKALGLKRDDTFSTTMLNYVIEQWSEDRLPYEDCSTEIPKFEIKSRNASSKSVSDLRSSRMSETNNETKNDVTDMSMDDM